MNARSLLMIAIACGGLTGCVDTMKAPPAARQDTVAQNQYPQVTLEQALQPWIGINKPIVTRENDVLKVSTPVRLLSDQGDFARVQYRYLFLDANGSPLRTQTEWKYASLEPRMQTFLEGNALDNHAADFRLEIRSAR